MRRSTQLQSFESIGSRKGACHQKQSGRSESTWEKTMFGSEEVVSPSSWKVICSEQIWRSPLPAMWQWALIHAFAPAASAWRLAKIRMARQACWLAIWAMRSVLLATASADSV